MEGQDRELGRLREMVYWRPQQVYEAGWLQPDKSKEVRGLLRHVIEDQNDNVVNYRLEDIDDAFGAYTALFICAKGGVQSEPWVEKRLQLIDRLESQLLRGYKKEVVCVCVYRGPP